MPRLIIVDDHPLFRNAAAGVLESQFGACKIVQAGSFVELEEWLSSDKNFDLILLDINLPDMTGLFGLLLVRAVYPEIPVAIVSAIDDPRLIRRAIDCGASGFIPKTQSVTSLRQAVQHIIEGAIWVPDTSDHLFDQQAKEEDLAKRFTLLTAQQLRVLGLLCQGQLNRQMGDELGITEATTKAHVSEILNKLGAHSRTQAVVFANKLNRGQTERLAV
ncbi:MAG: response regulator transcription factor [Pseudomonadota bacterium]